MAILSACFSANALIGDISKLPCGSMDLRFILSELLCNNRLVHELAHLIHSNHTEAFWNEVDKVMPDYQERKEWLRLNGAGMAL